MSKAFKIRLQKGDTVVVLSGKDKGKTGKITQTHPLTNKVTVEGINVHKKHQKPNKAYPQGGIVDLTVPVWVNKVALYEPTKKKPSKVAYKLSKDKAKTRLYKLTGKEVKA